MKQELLRLVRLPEERGLCAELLCEIDHHTARQLREEVDEAVLAARPALLVLDFSAVGFMDSSGLGLILGRLALCERIGAALEVRGASEGVARLLRLSGAAGKISLGEEQEKRRQTI